MTTIRLPVVSPSPAWTGARRAAFTALLILLAALAHWPAPTLDLLWNNIIPLLPVVFLLNPMIWRNVCPLATLNELTGSRHTRPGFTAATLVRFWAVGIVLLLLLVPARRVLFNEHATPLILTVLAVGTIAIGLGARVSRRGGFCNALCPVLPVEKLYGQAPLLEVGSARCHDCTLCTASGCIDLAGKRSARQSVRGGGGGGIGWMQNPFGLFVAAFPGFVVGYFVTTNTTLADAPAVYATVGAWSAGSLLLVAGLVAALRARPTTVMPILGASAIGLYYWFAAPSIATAYHLPGAGAIVIRVAMLGLAAVWLRGALSR